MKKSFMARIAPVMAVAAAAIIGFMLPGCDQSPGVIQNPQNVTPVAADFTVTGLSAYADGGPKSVSVRPKTGKSPGLITVYYEGTNGTVYPKNTASPSAAGKYAVTFDVAATEGFNEASGLRAGTLTINEMRQEDVEDEDDDYTDDNYEEEEKDGEDDYSEENENTEETVEPLTLVDFEDGAWAGKGYGKYANRNVSFKGYDWSVSGVTNMDPNDHYLGSRGIRFRGKIPDKTSDNDDKNINHLELVSFLKDGIGSISFDYASFSSHKGGTIILFCQKEEGEWEEVGRITNIPSWSGQMLNVKFEVNITDKARFRIEKINASGNTSVNIDNIVITY